MRIVEAVVDLVYAVDDIHVSHHPLPAMCHPLAFVERMVEWPQALLPTARRKCPQHFA